MTRRFLLTLLSSWIVNPLGILVAQGFGVANSPIVILVLLATGACVPFQLLMNECVAAAVSRGQAYAGRLQIALLLSTQAIACGVAIYVLSLQRFPALIIGIVVVFLAISSALSYRVSLRYYRLVMHSAVSVHAAIVIGVIPGVTSTLLYLIYSLAASRLPQMATGFIVASAVLPAIIQWRYLKKFKDTTVPTSLINSAPHATLHYGWLFAAVLALAALAAVSTRLRESVAHLSVNHVAVILVVLNSMLSLINTTTRTAFLQRAGGGQKRLLGVMAVVTASVGVAATADGWLAAPLIALVATQLAIAWVIEAARRVLVVT